MPNRGWIDQFKMRHGIVSKTICGEAGVVDGRLPRVVTTCNVVQKNADRGLFDNNLSR
jgi:hypothetical protein